jgi:uncharacterized protein
MRLRRPSRIPSRQPRSRQLGPSDSTAAEPIRSCAGCGRRAPQAELLRFGVADGTLTPGRTVPGRGVYTCRRLQCFERARARRAFNRVLKQTVEVPTALASLYTDPAPETEIEATF